jgi:transcriptional regulator with XRE-family HTH domain
MTQHRIRELRKARGLSGSKLGEMIGRTKHQISRLESGETKLDLRTADVIATALDVTIEEVLGLPSVRNGVAQGFSEDATAYTPSACDAISSLVSGHRWLYRIESDALEKIGIHKGDLVLVDDSAEAVKAVDPLKPVLVNWRSKAEPGRSVILLRQFVPPSLAITNAENNEMPLNLDGDIHIFAVCVQVIRSLS